jgi:hypothetical protein
VVRANLLTVLFEVVVPMVLFYGLRAAGVSQWWALMASVVAAAPHVLWTIARKRRVDLVGLVTLSVLVLSVVLGMLSSDPRTLAIREGWVAALGGPVRCLDCWSRSASASPPSSRWAARSPR